MAGRVSAMARMASRLDVKCPSPTMPTAGVEAGVGAKSSHAALDDEASQFVHDIMRLLAALASLPAAPGRWLTGEFLERSVEHPTLISA
jgi:hypothetical protein